MKATTHPPPYSTQVSLKNIGLRIRDRRIYTISATENGKAGGWKPPAHLSNTDLVPMPGEGDGTPLQYSCLENPMDGGTWWAAVHGVGKSRIPVSNFTFTFYFHALEKEMATHSSILAWRIPGMGEPGGLPSMGLHRVRHDWSDLAAVVPMPVSATG